MKRPLVLCILDGFAFRDETEGNAIKAANKPNLDKLFAEYPTTTLGASGMSVGLPDGQMGNSEVGHTNIGAGRIVYQELTRISKSIKDGDFFENEVLVSAIKKAVDAGKKVHIMGLMSSGGVHSHIEHCFGLLDLCKSLGAENVAVHAFMDGRDVSPTSCAGFIAQLENKISETGLGKIGTVSGRYYAMDRDGNYDRVKLAYDAMVNGIGEVHSDVCSYLKECYENGKTDEFIVPFIVNKDCTIDSGDTVIFFNFRPDRAREITRALVDPDFSGFEAKKLDLNYVCFTQYDASMPNVEIAFKPQSLKNTFGEYINSKEFTQLRIAETEKYAHVTFFFNGGIEQKYEYEDRVLVASPKVATYDLQPEMSAYEVTDKLIEKISTGKYDVIILNYANCDMVGHTGVFDAAVKAVEAVDKCVGRLYDAIIKENGILLITADHGNADQMVADNGSPFTQHTTNRVPFCVVNYPCSLREDGILADIAPTMLQMMDLPQPKEMDGKTLINFACHNC